MKQKWELLATVLGDSLNFKTRVMRKTAHHVYVNAARNRLRCNCREYQPVHYTPGADLADPGTPNWCRHIFALYNPGKFERVNHTELGKELFFPFYAAKAMESA